MNEAEKVVAETLQKSMERREVRTIKSIEELSGLIVRSLKDAGLLRSPDDVVEPTEQEVERAAKALERAGHAWINERDQGLRRADPSRSRGGIAAARRSRMDFPGFAG